MKQDSIGQKKTFLMFGIVVLVVIHEVETALAASNKQRR